MRAGRTGIRRRGIFRPDLSNRGGRRAARPVRFSTSPRAGSGCPGAEVLCLLKTHAVHRMNAAAGLFPVAPPGGRRYAALARPHALGVLVNRHLVAHQPEGSDHEPMPGILGAFHRKAAALEVHPDPFTGPVGANEIMGAGPVGVAGVPECAPLFGLFLPLLVGVHGHLDHIRRHHQTQSRTTPPKAGWEKKQCRNQTTHNTKGMQPPYQPTVHVTSCLCR